MPEITFHTFTMGDVDDPEVYVAQPIYEWQQTEHGKWVMAHCNDPKFQFGSVTYSFGHRVRLYGELTDKDAVFHELKWGHGQKIL